MSRHPSGHNVISESAGNQTQAAPTWLNQLLSLLLTSLVMGAALWGFAAAFGGALSPDRPLALIVTALVIALLTLILRAAQRKAPPGSGPSPQQERASQAIQRIEQQATKQDTRDDIVGTMREEIQTLIAPQSLDIAVYDSRNDRYQISGGETETERVLPANDPAIVWLLRQPVAVPIAVEATHLPADRRAGRTKMQLKDKTIVVPMGKQGWITLGASPQDDGTYTEEQLTTLQRLCRPASVGLQRVALLETQQRRAEELRALYWITQAVNFSMEIDDLMELIYTQLRRVMRLPNFYVALKDPDADTLSFSFYIENDEKLEPDFRWPVDEGLTGVIIKNNMTLRTDNYVEECQRRGLEPMGPKLGRAWMGTALTAGDRSIGVMVASSFDPSLSFSEEEENFFVTVAAYTAAILERQALYARLESRARQLATLNEIGNLLASSLDLSEVLSLVVKNAADLLNAEAGSLLLLDEDSGDLVFRISSGPAAEKLIGMRIPAGKGIAGAAFSENHPVVSQNTHKDDRWYGSADKRSEFVTQSVLAVPLNARGRTIGVLEAVNRKDSRAFTDEDIELLLSFGAQAAIAIENARLFTTTDQALQARLEELTTLQYIDRQLNATLDYGQVMDQTLEWALRLTGASIGMIAALHEEEDGSRGLRFLAYRGFESDIFERYTQDELWPLSNGLVGYTVQSGKTTLVTDVSQDSHYKEIAEGMQAQLTVPIKREERVIGVIAMESADVETFSEENVDFIERLADHAAIAIDNARLFQQVQQANAAKTEFISFVSHELKQPMTSMKGYADLLIKGVGGELTDNQLQFVKVIRSNVGRMDRIVQDLLDVSRIESGRLKLEIGPVVPEEVVSEAVQAFEQEISGKQQQLNVHIPSDLPTVQGDRGRLIQVLTNLLSNANKYTPEGGDIEIHAALSTDDGQACILWQVKDSGIGMTEDEVNQLFTKYFRSRRSEVRSIQGTGLGLVITRSIVEMHGGHIKVESEYGEGSTFSFTIPLSVAPVVARPAEST